MINSTVILGSTGSIGRQSVEVCKRLGIKAAALTTNKNIDLLLEQTKALRPEYVCSATAARPDSSRPRPGTVQSASSPQSPAQSACGPRSRR